MSLLRWRYTVLLRLRSLLRRDDVERELDEELRFHVERQIEHNLARGMTIAQARADALRALGGLEQRKEACRDVRRVSLVENLVRDARYAMRSLRRSPGFTSAAVLSLALGVGCNMAIFSLINGLLLRALPVTEPQRLALLSGGGSPNQHWTYAIWDQVRRQSHLFDGACAWGYPAPGVSFSLPSGTSGELQPIEGVFVSGTYFHTLGVQALLGRTLSESDDVRGGGPDGPVAVVSHAFWQRHLGGAADVVGTTVFANSVPFTVVGVTPPGFFGAEVGRTFDVAVPIETEALVRGPDTYLEHRAAYWLTVMVRLESAQAPEAATAALRAVQPQIREGALHERGRTSFLQEPLGLTPGAAGTSALRARYERPLLTLFVVATLVLLIACANVANLLLARSVSRQHEFAVRLALGGGRGRLAQQLFVESLMLATAGAAVGLLCAVWSSRALATYLSSHQSRVFLDLSIDWRVLVFATLVALATTVLFGATPMMRGTRARPVAALRTHGRTSSGEGRLGVSSGLIVGQVALSLMLVVAAGLFLQTFARLASVPLGFEADRVLVVTVHANRSEDEMARRLDLYQRLAVAAASVPGVENAAASGTTPLSGSVWGGNRIEVSGAPMLPETESTALVNFVTPQWFATYGTRLTAGRDISEADTATAPMVAVVNEAFVRKFLSDHGAIDRQVTQFPAQTTRSIVGVVEDALYGSVRGRVQPTMYIPLLQYDWSDVRFSRASISVRSASGQPARLAHSVVSALSEIDPDLVLTFRPLADQVQASLAQERLIAALSAVFGGLALLLAGVGLYGITSYAVNRRRAELGLRMALGATPHGVVRLVMRRVCALVALGVLIGGLASLWAVRAVAPLLYGLDPSDPATLIVAAMTLAAIGALAGCVPAWRASRIDPAHVLRET